MAFLPVPGRFFPCATPVFRGLLLAGCAHLPVEEPAAENRLFPRYPIRWNPPCSLSALGRNRFGVFIPDPGLVATNRHVVEGGFRGDVTLRLGDSSERRVHGPGDELPGTLVLKHPDLDLALITLHQSWDATPESASIQHSVSGARNGGDRPWIPEHPFADCLGRNPLWTLPGSSVGNDFLHHGRSPCIGFVGGP